MLKGIFRRKWIIAIVIVLIIGGFVGYTRAISPANTKPKETTTVKRGTLEEELTISGTIDAQEKITLRFQTSGRLGWIGVKEGDYVKKYQGLATLDRRELEKTLKKKLLAYMDERWDFEQAQDDQGVHGKYLKDVVDLSDGEKRILEKAQFGLDDSVLDVEIQSLAIEYANLWTPIEGIVTRVGAPYAGMNITPTSAEFEIINPNTIFFSATADQSEVVKLAEGMVGKLVLDSYPDSTISGTISNISFIPKTGETSTSYTVKFMLNSDLASNRYRIGMGGDLTLVPNIKTNILFIPENFIKNENGKKYVLVKTTEKEEKVYVTTGMETPENIEILTGLQEGDTVVL